MDYGIRRWYRFAEEVVHDGGAPADPTLIKAAAAVAIENPFAGGHVHDLEALIEPSARLGAELPRRAIELLEGRPVEGYGKGGIAGVNGEQEHVVAYVTTPFGDALREASGGGAAWISSATKVASAGEPLDLPLAHKDALYVRSHYDAITIRLADAPRPNELLVALAVSSGGRVHQRVGGLSADEAVGDGQR